MTKATMGLRQITHGSLRSIHGGFELPRWSRDGQTMAPIRTAAGPGEGIVSGRSRHMARDLMTSPVSTIVGGVEAVNHNYASHPPNPSPFVPSDS